MIQKALLAVTLALIPGCPAVHGDATKAEGKKAMQAKLTDLDTLRGLVGMKQNDFIAKHGVAQQNVRTSAVFERLANLTEVYDSALSPARFYFKDGALFLIYLEGSAALVGQDGNALKTRLGGEGSLLRSRAGKASNLHVYAEKGTAVSLSDEVDFIQLFPAMSQADYEQTIYQDPGKFVL